MDAFVLVYTNKSKKEADTTPESDFADLECEASAKSRYWAYMCEQQRKP